MPRRNQPRTDVPDEQQPPWPDQFTQSQYDQPEQMSPQDRASTGHQPYSESAGPEVAKAENLEQNTGSQVGDLASRAAETIQTVSENISEQVGSTSRAAADKASALVSRTVNRAQSMASELESFTRRKPFSALAGAFLAGIAFVLLGRRRRS